MHGFRVLRGVDFGWFFSGFGVFWGVFLVFLMFVCIEGVCRAFGTLGFGFCVPAVFEVWVLEGCALGFVFLASFGPSVFFLWI